MEHDANAKTGGSDTQSQSTQAAGALGWRPDAGEPTEGSVGPRDVCKETDELVDAHPLRIAEAQNQRTVKSCRFCWMCRHLCTVGNQTWLESTTPRGRALNLYSVLKGAGKFDSEVADVIYKCSLCGLCKEFCVGAYDMPTLVRAAREDLVHSGLAPSGAMLMRESIREGGTPWDSQLLRKLGAGVVNSRGASPGLADRSQSPVLLFAGCAARSLRPSIIDAMVKILDVAHVRFTMLENEVCCGLPLYDEGFREEAREQAVGIGASIASTECKVLVSLCPTCVWAFRDVYPDLGVNLGGELEILHSSEFIFRLLTDGGLNAGPRADGVPHASDKFVVTYHDPCSMGRILHKYETPREVIGSLPGVELREMRWARDHAHCCGGASVHTLYPEVGEPIATTRAGEALETGAGVLVSTCPSCEHHLSEAAGDGLEVLDVAELVASILEL